MCAVAYRLAWVVADPTVDGGEGIVGDQLTPGLLVASGPAMGKPRLDILASGAPGVARRHQVETGRRSRTGPARGRPCSKSGRAVTSPRGTGANTWVPSLDCSAITLLTT